jgi:two-component system response regulator DesR
MGASFGDAAVLVRHMRRQRLMSVPDPDRHVRVLVVDDHALFAEALMLTLAIEERIEIVGCASSGVEAVALVRALRPDVVLMDVHMPGMDGIEATRQVRQVSPETRVVMVTAARSSEVAAHALAAGAERYLTKDTPALKLIDAILGARSVPLPATPVHPVQAGRIA